MGQAISADPYETRRFALKVFCLTLAGGLVLRFAGGLRRNLILMNVVIGIATSSALFGIVRQTVQHARGFILPLLPLDLGYGQFINKNHFAYLMEMALGLGLGLLLRGGTTRERNLVYCAAILPIITGLILCSSRGGIVSVLGQVVFAVMLLPKVGAGSRSEGEKGIGVRLQMLAGSLLVRLVLAAAFVGVMVIGVVWIGGDPLVEKFQAARGEFVEPQNNMRTGERRIDIWRATSRLVRLNMLAGVGLGAYWAAIPEYHDASGRVTPQQAHNDYLELVASGGIIALGIGAWFLYEIVRQARKRLANSADPRRFIAFGAIVGLSGVAIHSVFDFGLHVTINALIFMALLALLVDGGGEWGGAKQPLANP